MSTVKRSSRCCCSRTEKIELSGAEINQKQSHTLRICVKTPASAQRCPKATTNTSFPISASKRQGNMLSRMRYWNASSACLPKKPLFLASAARCEKTFEILVPIKLIGTRITRLPRAYSPTTVVEKKPESRKEGICQASLSRTEDANPYLGNRE